MPVTVQQLAAPIGVTATVVAGGSLAASTTYYYRIVTIESTNSAGRCSNMRVMGLPSAEVTATTTGVNKAIKLDWTLPSKTYATGTVLNMLVFRTTVSGDYSTATAKFVQGAANAATETALNGAVTFTDDGTRTLSKAELSTLGYPRVEITGGSTGTPVNEEDIYQAFVTAGIAATHTQKSVAADNTVLSYFFQGMLFVSDSAAFFAIRPGKSVVVYGGLRCNSTMTFRMGSKNNYGTGFNGKGSQLGIINCVYDFGNGPGGVLEIYGSRVYDAFTNLEMSQVCPFWGSAPSFNGFGGSSTATKGIIENSIYYSFGSNNNYSGNIDVINTVVEGEPRIEGSSNYTPAFRGVTFYGSQLYSYASSYVRVDNCTLKGTAGPLVNDIFFHGGSATDLRFIDLVDFTPRNEPLQASGTGTFETATYYLRRWSLNALVKDGAGSPLQDAKLRIHNAAGHSDTFENVVGTHTGTLLSTDTSFALTSVAGLSIGDYIKVEAEVMLITNIVSTTLTVTRAQQGTIANNWRRASKAVSRQVPYTLTNASGVIAEQYYLSQMLQGNTGAAPYPYDTTSYGPHVTVITKYGYKPVRISGTVSAKQALAPLLLVDTVIEQTNEATVAAYTGITIDHGTETITVSGAHTLRELYDYCQRDRETVAGITYPEFFISTDGIAFSCAYDLVVTAALSGAGTISMPTKTLTISGGGSVEATVTDSVGTTARLRITLPLPGMSVCVHDGDDAQFYCASGESGVIDLVIPTGATGTWTWGINKQGYVFATGAFTPAPGGVFPFAPSCPQVLTSDGNPMYQGTTSALVQVGFSGGYAYIDIGDGTPPLQAIYDACEDALYTDAGITWIIDGGDGISIFESSAGDFCFMTGGWRVRRWHAGDANATVPAFCQSVDGVVVDDVNGSVTFQTSDNPTTIAAAVWAHLSRTLTGVADANIVKVNSVTVKGTGTNTDPWNPA